MSEGKTELLAWTDKQLGVVFLFALLVFSVGRWDAEGWLHRQFDAVIEQSQINMYYTEWSLDGMGVRLKDLSVRLPTLPKTLVLDEVEVKLDWAALLGGELAATVVFSNALMDATASLGLPTGQIKIRDFNGQCDVAAMQAWLEIPLTVQLSGQATLKGDAILDRLTGTPITADLDVKWLGASVGMMQQNYRLGDYALVLSVADHQGQWSLQGGETLQLKGDGKLAMQASSPLLWGLQGAVSMQAGAGSPLVSILPSHGQNIILAGNLKQPKWSIVEE